MNYFIATLLVVAGALCIVCGYKMPTAYALALYIGGVAHGIVAGYILRRRP